MHQDVQIQYYEQVTDLISLISVSNTLPLKLLWTLTGMLEPNMLSLEEFSQLYLEYSLVF
jgi:hypothetical protein